MGVIGSSLSGRGAQAWALPGVLWNVNAFHIE